MAVQQFDYLEFFKEEIQNESASIRLSALSNVVLIASAIGPQRAADELIPFCTKIVRDESLATDEEFLFTMAKQYAELSNFIDDRNELLMAPLEALAAEEETVIRDEAIISMCLIAEKNPKLGDEYLVLQRNGLSEVKTTS